MAGGGVGFGSACGFGAALAAGWAAGGGGGGGGGSGIRVRLYAMVIRGESSGKATFQMLDIPTPAMAAACTTKDTGSVL
jgi:hypothetical protein